MIYRFNQKQKKKLYLLTIAAVLVIATLLMMQIPLNNGSTLNVNPQVLQTTVSTNPLIPDYMPDDSLQGLEAWSTGYQHYYYETYSLSSTDYHLVWLRYTQSYDMDLYLYSDSDFLTEIESSMRGSEVEWLVYNPSSSGPVYPTAYTDSSSGNTGYIEAESATEVSVGSSTSISFSTYDYAELFEVYLSSSNTYTIRLTIPMGAAYDLRVFRTASGSTTELDSQTSISGTPRTIIFTPTSSADYAILVIRTSGSGSATLSINYPVIPGFDLFWILIATISALAITLSWFKKDQSPFL